MVSRRCIRVLEGLRSDLVYNLEVLDPIIQKCMDSNTLIAEKFMSLV